MDEKHRVLLIDLDNCPKQVNALPQSLGEFTRVIACHRAGGDPKVPLSLVSLLAGTIEAGRLQIVAMPRAGKNAADLGLSFWAGHLAAELPEETVFVVLSKDGDLDHVVDMLRSINRQAERVTRSSSASPECGSNSLQPNHPAADEYWASLLRIPNSRPGRKKTLLKSIKAFFRQRQPQVSSEDVLASLLERGLVQTTKQGRVTYYSDGEALNDVFESEPLAAEPDRDGDVPF
ncbi:MAG: hypothetical protein GY906_39410 [bacterium]|nr:hypothetical protein [bacterium]